MRTTENFNDYMQSNSGSSINLDIKNNTKSFRWTLVRILWECIRIKTAVRGLHFIAENDVWFWFCLVIFFQFVCTSVCLIVSIQMLTQTSIACDCLANRWCARRLGKTSPNWKYLGNFDFLLVHSFCFQLSYSIPYSTGKRFPQFIVCFLLSTCMFRSMMLNILRWK